MPPRSTYGGRKQKRRTSLRPNQRSRDARAITPLSFVNAKVKKRRTALWRAGGTGRRRRLKIVRPQGHGGSSPSPATIIIKALALRSRKACGSPRSRFGVGDGTIPRRADPFEPSVFLRREKAGCLLPPRRAKDGTILI